MIIIAGIWLILIAVGFTIMAGVAISEQHGPGLTVCSIAGLGSLTIGVLLLVLCL